MELLQNSEIYKLDDGRLACDIPAVALPIARRRELIVDRYIEPGYRYTAPDWFYTTVRAYPDSTALILRYGAPSTAENIINYGLDPTKRIQIMPYGTNRWIDAHLIHYTTLLNEQGLYDPEHGVRKPIRGRVWVPKRPSSYWASKHNLIRRETIYPVKIRGMTLPTIRETKRWKSIRDIIVQYLNQQYRPVEYEDDQYRWIIPTNIVCNNALNRALQLGHQPIAQFYVYNDLIYANFMFPGFEIQMFRAIGRCYRCTSNIQLGLTDERKYRFYFDIKSHYLSICPQTYYVDPTGTPLVISEALAWTNRNLLMNHPGFMNIRAGMKHDKLWVEGLISKFSTKNYIGTENQQIDFGEAEIEHGMIYRLYYAEKTVIYTGSEPYGTQRVEDTMIGARRIWVNKDGFVWRR